MKIILSKFGRIIFLLYICPINQINNNMKNLFIEAARRDIQMMLNAMTENHVEVLVAVKKINIEGLEMPFFNPMEICKN